jgi:hypothetical protein
MLENISKLNLVRIGSYITYSSLKKIGDDLLESFPVSSVRSICHIMIHR